MSFQLAKVNIIIFFSIIILFHIHSLQIITTVNLSYIGVVFIFILTYQVNKKLFIIMLILLALASLAGWIIFAKIIIMMVFSYLSYHFTLKNEIFVRIFLFFMLSISIPILLMEINFPIIELLDFKTYHL